MKKIVTCIATFFCLLTVGAQPNFTYTAHINQAELYSIEGHYQVALGHFDSAFASEKLIFGKDLYNALLCATRTGANEKAAHYFEQLLRKGYLADSIALNSKFAGFVQSKQYRKKMKEWEDGKLSVDNTIIGPLALLMDTLHNDDQYFRIRDGKNYANGEYAKIIRLLDSVNALKLATAISQYGFPNEFNCGITAWYKRHPYIVIVHQGYGSIKGKQVDFAPQILTAIKNRQVLPNVGLGLFSRVAGSDSLFGIDCFFRVKQKNGSFRYAYYPNYSPEIEAKFNANRKAYGLEPLADYRKKMLYWLKHKDFAFEFKEGVQTIPINEDVVPYLTGLTYIE